MWFKKDVNSYLKITETLVKILIHEEIEIFNIERSIKSCYNDFWALT